MDRKENLARATKMSGLKSNSSVIYYLIVAAEPSKQAGQFGTFVHCDVGWRTKFLRE